MENAGGEVVPLAGIGGDVVDLQLAGQDRFAIAVDRHHLRLPAVIEKRFHGLADDDFRIALQQTVRRVDAGPIENRVEDAARADRDATDAVRDARSDENERNVHRGLIEQIAMLLLAMLAETFAVIAGEHDRDRTVHLLLKRGSESSELSIHERNLAVVRLFRIAAAKRFRRRVGIVRIVVVDPEKERLRRRPLQKVDRAIRRLLRGPFGTSARQLVIVNIESSRQSEAPRQGEGRHERRRSISGRMQSFADQRLRIRDVPRVFVNAVAGGIEARQHRRMRRQRLRHRRVCPAEAPAPRRQIIERRRRHSDRFLTGCIGARRVERDKENRRPLNGGGRGCFLVTRGRCGSDQCDGDN